MWLARLKYQLLKFSKFQSRWWGGFNFDWSGVFLQLILVGIILVMGINIYTAYSRGLENIKKIGEEEQKLQQLEQEHADLAELEKYYNSLEYKRMYLRDNLALAEREETIFVIKKDEKLEIEGLPEEPEQLLLNNQQQLWQAVLLGI